MSEDPNDDNLEELIKVKLALNMEADKEEVYWSNVLEPIG